MCDAQKSVVHQAFDNGIDWFKNQMKRPKHCTTLEESDTDKKEVPPAEAPSTKTHDDSECDKWPPFVCKPHTLPNETHCIIKMQDPYELPCCDPKSNLPPCPPESYPQQPREPECSCDLCKKNQIDRKCCQRKKSLYEEENDSITLDIA